MSGSLFSHSEKLLIKSGGRLKYIHKIRLRFLSSTPGLKKREGFGSFHSQDVETLIRQSDSEYKIPVQLLEVEDVVRSKSSVSTVPCDFGPEMKKKLFMLRESDTFINHGAFGAAIRPLYDLAAAWRDVLERNPLEFFDRTLLPVLAHSVRVMAAHLRCPATELVPLPNVTTGLNSIFNSLELHTGDEIICFSLTYGATKTMLRHLAARTGATLTIIDLPLPIVSTEVITATFEKHISKKTKLVVLDQITSNTALVLPIHALGRLAKAVGATVVVDAAHALGSQEVEIYPTSATTQGLHEVCDVWLSNGHKWLCMPRGCAFMWVHSSLHGRLRPAIVSHGYIPGHKNNIHRGDLYTQEGRLLSGFVWDGCRDYASILTTASALHFWGHRFPSFLSQVSSSSSSSSSSHSSTTTANSASLDDGWRMMRGYNRQLLQQATQMLEANWGVSCTQQVAPSELTLTSPMRLVPLPPGARADSDNDGFTDDHAFNLQEELYSKFKITVPVKCLHGRFYVRISAHVYNCLSDYEKLSQAVRTMLM